MIHAHDLNFNKKKYIHELLESREFRQYQRKARTRFETLQLFFEQFIKSFPEDYLNFLSSKDLLKFIIQRFKFISTIKESGNRFEDLKISIQTIPEDSWIVNAHVIEILYQDMAFIKNSILELIQKEGLQIRYVISNIFDLNKIHKNRNKKTIAETSPETSPGSVENYFHTYIIIEKQESFDPDYFVQKISGLLFHINFVTSDFKNIVDTIQAVHIDSKVSNFFQWLCRDNFIFFSLSDDSRKFGLFKDKAYASKIKECMVQRSSGSYHVIKTDMESQINRRENIIIIQYKDLVLTGIFTRKADHTSSLAIPFLSDKLSNLIKLKEGEWTSLDIRDFIYALDLLPLVYRFIIPIEGYIDFSALLYQARITVESKARLRTFKKNQYFLLIIWPVNELNEEFQKRFRRFLSNHNLKIKGEVDRVLSSVVYLMYELEYDTSSGKTNTIKITEFEISLLAELISWDKKFILKAETKYIFEKFLRLKKYIQAMIESNYRDRHDTEEALLDLENLQLAAPLDKLIKGEYLENKDRTYVKIFAKKVKSLSYFVPLFSNMDINVISDESYQFFLEDGPVYYYKFDLQYNNEAIKNQDTLNRLCETIDCIMDQVASSEPLNSIILNTNLSIYQVELLKALVAYLMQVKKSYSRVLLKKILQNSPDLACAIIYSFELKFLELINSNGDLRKKCENSIKKKIKNYPSEINKIHEFTKYLNQIISQVNIKNIIQNELYHTLKMIIGSIVRTNYFTDDDLISIKINSQEIEVMPQPSPLYEIWVYHPHFEAVHMRGGAISRGGIRWSDRQDDFHTEIWGLWKTQVLKNTVIVPTGAKGGFVLKYIPNSRENAIVMYKKFMTALIRLTDNRINNASVRNEDIPAFDDPDHYLVVAADKGTAAFSDYANDISNEKRFWLDDAFASGGKNGYSHKALGITALGAWESARWHLYRIGKDLKTDEVSIIGIGDMSGDVFGNGLIYSDKIRLIGAFNHKYIFLDPQPDIAKSYKERNKLFKQAEDWDKYDIEIISKGGGIFERESIDIKLNPAARDALATEKEIVTGEELIRLMLKSPVDILFNGGVGTYIKSSSESNHEIDDLSNDSVRVNSNEIRAKIIIEGGNLGVSKAGRIEFALLGGYINTDAIDNSAGVDLSDHEVNLKILFRIFMVHGIIKSFDERNRRLKRHAAELVKLVLQNNFRQNWALVYLQSLPSGEAQYILELLELLKEKKLWIDNAENVRDRQLIVDCMQEKKPIPSPLLAHIHSLSKIYLERSFEITGSSDLYNAELQKYFPVSLGRFKDLYIKHPLKNDIIKMMLVNKVMDYIGYPGLVKCMKYLQLDPPQILSYYIKVQNILHMEDMFFNKYLPNLEKRKIPSDYPLELTLAVKNRKEDAIYNIMELLVLFNINITDDKNIYNFPEIGANFFTQDFEPAVNSNLGKDELLELFQINNIELRFTLKLLSDKKEGEYNNVYQMYFDSGMLNLKTELYSIKPQNQWEIQSHMTLKKAFWNGLMKSDLHSLALQIEKINLNNELQKLKEAGNLNLSAFTGILAFLFQ